FEDAPCLGLRLSHDDLGLALSGGARFLAQLLRRDERLVHRALTLPVYAQLLPERRQPLLEHRLLAQDPLELVGDAYAEVLDAERLVAAQAATELLLAHIVRREMEGVAAHCAIAPGASAGAQPLFCASPATFTCSSTRCLPPCAAARLSSSSASGPESTEWTSAKRPATCFALLRWRCPTRCHLARRPTGVSSFSSASCTRFSPTSVSPAARAASTAST